MFRVFGDSGGVITALHSRAGRKTWKSAYRNEVLQNLVARYLYDPEYLNLKVVLRCSGVQNHPHTSLAMVSYGQWLKCHCPKPGCQLGFRCRFCGLNDEPELSGLCREVPLYQRFCWPEPWMRCPSQSLPWSLVMPRHFVGFLPSTGHPALSGSSWVL